MMSLSKARSIFDRVSRELGIKDNPLKYPLIPFLSPQFKGSDSEMVILEALSSRFKHIKDESSKRVAQRSKTSGKEEGKAIQRSELYSFLFESNEILKGSHLVIEYPKVYTIPYSDLSDDGVPERFKKSKQDAINEDASEYIASNEVLSSLKVLRPYLQRDGDKIRGYLLAKITAIAFELEPTDTFRKLTDLLIPLSELGANFFDLDKKNRKESLKLIKREYRKISLKTHPDRTDAMLQKMKGISEEDKEKIKDIYDQYFREASQAYDEVYKLFQDKSFWKNDEKVSVYYCTVRVICPPFQIDTDEKLLWRNRVGNTRSLREDIGIYNRRLNARSKILDFVKDAWTKLKEGGSLTGEEKNTVGGLTDRNIYRLGYFSDLLGQEPVEQLKQFKEVSIENKKLILTDHINESSAKWSRIGIPMLDSATTLLGECFLSEEQREELIKIFFGSFKKIFIQRLSDLQNKTSYLLEIRAKIERDESIISQAEFEIAAPYSYVNGFLLYNQYDRPDLEMKMGFAITEGNQVCLCLYPNEKTNLVRVGSYRGRSLRIEKDGTLGTGLPNGTIFKKEIVKKLDDLYDYEDNKSLTTPQIMNGTTIKNFFGGKKESLYVTADEKTYPQFLSLKISTYNELDEVDYREPLSNKDLIFKEAVFWSDGEYRYLFNHPKTNIEPPSWEDIYNNRFSYTVFSSDKDLQGETFEIPIKEDCIIKLQFPTINTFDRQSATTGRIKLKKPFVMFATLRELRDIMTTFYDAFAFSVVDTYGNTGGFTPSWERNITSFGSTQEVLRIQSGLFNKYDNKYSKRGKYKPIAYFNKFKPFSIPIRPFAMIETYKKLLMNTKFRKECPLYLPKTSSNETSWQKNTLSQDFFVYMKKEINEDFLDLFFEMYKKSEDKYAKAKKKEDELKSAQKIDFPMWGKRLVESESTNNKIVYMSAIFYSSRKYKDQNQFYIYVSYEKDTNGNLVYKKLFEGNDKKASLYYIKGGVSVASDKFLKSINLDWESRKTVPVNVFNYNNVKKFGATFVVWYMIQLGLKMSDFSNLRATNTINYAIRKSGGRLMWKLDPKSKINLSLGSFQYKDLPSAKRKQYEKELEEIKSQ